MQNSILIILLFTLTSCSTYKKIFSKDIHSSSGNDGVAYLISKDNEAENEVEEKTAVEVYAPIGLVENEIVNKWVKYFSGKGKERFQRFLDRGFFYKEVVQTILEENGMPNELYYLAMIESGYVSHARSHAAAVGPWQFMAGTAKMYDLEIDYYVDERRDPIRATEAAAKYLKDLYNAFRSWELAMAAYNTGEHRILRAIMKGDSRDYWMIVKKKLIPRETRNYVGKFMAAVMIGNNPEAYGFVDPAKNNLEIYPDVVSFELPSPVRLDDVARVVQIDAVTLKRINPHLRRGMTPPQFKSFEVWLPKNHVKQTHNSLAQISKLKIKKKYYKRSPSRYHIVRRGDNISSISRRYNQSISSIKRINHLRSSRIYPGQKLRVSTKEYRSSGSRKYYFVKRGDNLNRISRSSGISVRRLKKLNNLRNSRIYIGQKLIVNSKLNTVFYKVRRGDSLARIAGKFGVSIAHLKKKNRIRGSRIFIGQKLKI